MSDIRVMNLTKIFGDVVAVDQVSIYVPDKKFFTLLGPSGCGKTTLLRCVAGLEVQSEGDINIGGRLVSSLKEKVFVPPEERSLGMVFQSYAVWPHMTVFDNVAYPLKIKKIPKEKMKKRTAEMLSLVRLEELEGRYPHQISGGQQQRVALARALVMNPDVLLLDEPLSNLDAKLREEMRFEIKEIQRRTGVTILYVTHDQTEAMVMSDQVAIMYQGAIRQIGTPSEVYANPEDSFVAGFIGLANFIEFKEISIGKEEAIIQLFDQVELRCMPPMKRKGEKLLLVVRPADIEILSAPAPNTARGTIRKAAFMGDLVDYHVEVGGQSIRVQHRPTVALRQGETAYLRFNSGTLVSV